jgi:microcystin-dependent protein
LLLPASSSMKICRHRHSSLQNARSPLHMHARATSQTDVRSTKRYCICELACQKIELATADQSRVPAFSTKKFQGSGHVLPSSQLLPVFVLNNNKNSLAYLYM